MPVLWHYSSAKQSPGCSLSLHSQPVAQGLLQTHHAELPQLCLCLALVVHTNEPSEEATN